MDCNADRHRRNRHRRCMYLPSKVAADRARPSPIAHRPCPPMPSHARLFRTSSVCTYEQEKRLECIRFAGHRLSVQVPAVPAVPGTIRLRSFVPSFVRPLPVAACRLVRLVCLIPGFNWLLLSSPPPSPAYHYLLPIPTRFLFLFMKVRTSLMPYFVPLIT